MVPSERILVVDDERDMRFVIESLLRAHGYEAEEVRSGEEAIARLHQERFDAIVLDYRMPGLNGIDVARRLQRFVVGTPVVLFSAYLNERVTEEASELSLHVLDKSDLPRLPETLQTLIRGR